MSIKSTTHLTRGEALDLFADLSAKVRGARVMSDEELGNMLDLLDETVCQLEGRTCFTNYLVTEKRSDVPK